MATLVSSGDSPVYEGFLCPMCLQDFDTVYKLQSHVESAHGTEDKAVLNQLKGFFGKAKRLITNKPEEQLDDSAKGDSASEGGGSPTRVLLGTDPHTWDSQELGATNSHFDFLRSIRSNRIDRTVVEINKLVIRLEKLMRQGPPWSDQTKRKAYEKTVVPWTEDADVKFCPSCGDKFSLAVRRHHCRLCGGIMCNKCSNFVGLPFCEQVLTPEAGPSKSKPPEAEGSPAKKTTEITLRVCNHCQVTMDKRLKMFRDRTTKAPIVQMYEKMIEVRETIAKQLPPYEAMALSLVNGEESYSYERAEKERNILLKYCDALDLLSKKIYSLGSGTGKPLSTSQLRLRKHIRAEVVRFLQDNMLGLQTLPSKEEVMKLQAQRRAAIAKKLEEERQARAQKMQAEAKLLERTQKAQTEAKHLDGPKRGHERKSSWGLLDKIKEQAQEVGAGMMGGFKVGHDSKAHMEHSGWKPSAVSQASVQELSDDPLIQQMNIISSYLNQAQEAGKWDEVNMLEANLKELQLVYREEQARKSSPSGQRRL